MIDESIRGTHGCIVGSAVISPQARPMDVLKKWVKAMGGGAPMPRHLQIEPTTCCNLRCEHCINRELPATRRARSMTFDFFTRIVDQIPSLREVKLQGLGEPLSAPDLLKILEWGRSRNLQYDLITNGMMPIAKTLAVVPFLAKLGISLDTISENTSRILRAGSRTEQILRTIKALVCEKHKANSPVIIRINCVVSHLNKIEVPEVLRVASDLGVDMVNLVLVENWKMPGDSEYEKSKDFVSTAQQCVDLNLIKEEYERRGYAFCLGIQGGEPRKGFCYWTFTSAFLTCDGYVTPCCIRPDPRSISFGNLHESSFKTIWLGKKMRAFRRTHLLGWANTVCDHCPG